MAIKVLNKSTTNLSTAADWDSVTNTPTLHASTNITNIGAVTPKYTATFTAPNTTNACTGVWIFINGDFNPDVTITVTLQENTVNTVCTHTIAGIVYDTGYDRGWRYIRFPTPYVFTSTTAGYYRFAITSSNGSVDAAADSAGTAIAFIATDNRTSAPAATDNLWIGGDVSSPVVLTLSGTNSWGGGTEISAANRQRASIGQAMLIGAYGSVKEDTTTNNTTTIAGVVEVVNGGTWERGTESVPMGSSVLSRVIITTTSHDGDGVIVDANGALTWHGNPKTYWKTTYSIGVGTATDPLIVTDSVDWTVGDYLMFAPTSDSATNYAELEKKYIITKNSATSYVLSDTAGGAESALTYTHDEGVIVNTTNNVTYESNGSNQPYLFASSVIVRSGFSGKANIDWVTFNKTGYVIGVYVQAGHDLDNSVMLDYRRYGFRIATKNQTHSNLFLHSTVVSDSTNSGCYFVCRGDTINDVISMGSYYSTFYMAQAFATTFNRCMSIAAGIGNASAKSVGFVSSARLTFNDCEFHACRGNNAVTYGVFYFENATNIRFNDCLIGTKGANKNIANALADSFATVIFSNCDFGVYTSLQNSYLGTIDGSYINYAPLTYGGDDNYSYTPYGIRSSNDTTVHTSGTGAYSLQFFPEDSESAISWSFEVPTGSLEDVDVTISCWVKINNANYYAGTHQNPELCVDYDNGTEACIEAIDSTDWQKLVVSFTPTTNYGKIVITISGYTDATSTDAYFWLDDFGGGYLVNATLDLWADGLPVSPVFAFVINASQFWTAASNIDYGVNTMAELVKQTEKKVDDNTVLILGK